MDRRTSSRYPIACDVRYKVLGTRAHGKSGTGKTIEISSEGVRFAAESSLPVRALIELSITWPAKLNEICGLKLVVRGRVIRSAGNTIAVRIDKSEFRTRALKKSG
jgi:hypothetical protein